jgi:hypothetical protein
LLSALDTVCEVMLTLRAMSLTVTGTFLFMGSGLFQQLT